MSSRKTVSRISQAYPDRVEVRGRDLTGELMGQLGFTEYFYLLLTGREPTEEQRFFLDLLLVAIAEHGMMPTNVAARMTLAADPQALQGAVAAGILGAGPVFLGTSEACAELLTEAQGKVEAGGKPEDVAKELAGAIKGSGERVPGFGHPVHKPLDPRAERIFELAEEHKVAGVHVKLAHCFRDAVNEGREKPLTLNISMPMAAVMLDLGFTADTVKAVPLLARTAGLLAHLAEERQNPVGFQMAKAAEDSVTYEPPDGEPRIVASENEELYRRGVDAFNRRDKEAWMQTCDPEVESVPPRDWPEPRVAKGHDDVWDIFVANMGIFDAAELEIVGAIVEGEGTLVAQLQGETAGKSSGAPVIWSFQQVVTIRDGVAVRFNWFTDRDEALEAAGINEPAAGSG